MKTHRRKLIKKSPKFNFLAVDGIEMESNELSMGELYKFLKKISKEFGQGFRNEKPPYYMG